MVSWCIFLKKFVRKIVSNNVHTFLYIISFQRSKSEVKFIKNDDDPPLPMVSIDFYSTIMIIISIATSITYCICISWRSRQWPLRFWLTTRTLDTRKEMIQDVKKSLILTALTYVYDDNTGSSLFQNPKIWTLRLTSSPFLFLTIIFEQYSKTTSISFKYYSKKAKTNIIYYSCNTNTKKNLKRNTIIVFPSRVK